jgi:hypothetical protein
MASAYYNAAVDLKWDTPGNWWADSGFSTPLSTMSGLPEFGDDIYVYGTIDGYVSSPPPPLNNGYFYGIGFGGGIDIWVGVSITFSGDVSFNNGYQVGGTSVTLTVSGTLTFNNNSGIGNGVSAWYFPASITASSIIFNNTSGGNTYGSTLNGPTTLNDSASIGYVVLNSDTTLNDTSSIYYAVPYTNYFNGTNLHLYDSSSIDTVSMYTGMVPSTVYLHDTNTANNISAMSCCYNVVIYYPGPSTFSGSSYNIYYANYPTLYLWNTLGSATWDSSSDWWIDSAHTQQTYTLPDSNTDTIIDSNVTSGFGSAVKSLTIGNNNYIAISTITVIDDATFNNSSYIDSLGTVSGPCIFKDTSYNNGIADGAATFGIDNGTDTSYNSGTVNGAATFYANTYATNTSSFLSTVSFYDSSINNATINDASFYNLSSNQGILTTGSFNDTSDNAGSCETPTYDDSSTATSATYVTNLNITITGNPVNSYTMDTSTLLYTFTRGGGGGGINGSSILGIL